MEKGGGRTRAQTVGSPGRGVERRTQAARSLSKKKEKRQGRGKIGEVKRNSRKLLQK